MSSSDDIAPDLYERIMATPPSANNFPSVGPGEKVVGKLNEFEAKFAAFLVNKLGERKHEPRLVGLITHVEVGTYMNTFWRGVRERLEIGGGLSVGVRAEGQVVVLPSDGNAAEKAFREALSAMIVVFGD